MATPKKVLITGASGMIARRVATALQAEGIETVALSRSGSGIRGFSASFAWNPDNGTYDKAALNDVDTIVHLAGAGIADKRWTSARKQEIIASRVDSTLLLQRMLQECPSQVKSIVCASATGFYGDTGSKIMTEDHPSGSGFLADTCLDWEQALARLSENGRRTVILRIGFVIDRTAGALPVMARPVRFLVGAPYASGKQYISWIDSEDLVRLFRFAMQEESLTGTYNAVAPQPVTNRQFVASIAKVLRRPIWPIGVPKFIFSTLLGEQSELVLGSQRVSADKIAHAGFQFHYSDLEHSLTHHLS